MSSIASQLQAIKSALGSAPESTRRPITRPSVLFDAKEAADIDLRAILPIALSGLEHLTGVDERFARYSSTLFSQTSLEVNREQQTQKENDKLNKSISSYLGLLAGYLQLPAALKTLEYLIRRYLVHVYNVDELLLCALPYHDTHAFVRIVQLVNLGNSKWTFLDGVKSSGAPPPRSVLVQQCIRDTSLLETLSNYAAPKKGFLHSRTVVCFCTAVIVECLGAIPKLDSNIVQRVVGYVFDSLNPDIGADRDYKAGALMIVGVLATRATLAPKLVQDLIIFVAKAAQHDALESVDLPWLRVTVMAIISLVQSQSVHEFRKKPLMILKDIRDFSGVLSVLSSEFNIENFVRLYVESLVDYSTSDESCHVHLIETMETIPIKNFVERIVRKVLGNCIKASRVTDNPDINRTGIWAKKIFAAIEKKYSCELRDAIRKFLEESEINSVKGDSSSKLLSLVFDESKSMPAEISDANIWFSLDHPKAVVRQSALSKIAKSDILKKSTANPEKFINMQDAIIRSLYDDDLSVVQAALSIEGLAAIASPRGLLKAYDDLLVKCTDIIHKGGSKTSKACDVAVSCLEKMVMEYQVHHMEHAKDIATVVFGLLIVHPKTLKVNLKALELAKKIQWDFYASSPLVYELTDPEAKDVRSSAMKFIEGLSLVWQRLSTSVSKNGNNGKFPMSSPAFGVFLESLANQKAMISSDARFLPAYISSMLSPSQDLMVPENLHERIDQPTKDAILNFILHSSLKLSPYGKLMVLSALKGVGTILFKAEEVKSLFLYLLDRRSQYQSGHDSKQVLTTHETQILCLLLEVLFAVADQTNFGFDTFEALLKALKVDGLSHEDPVAVMPCLTALQNLQPVFFENLKNDTKDKVFGLLISLFRAENLEIRNATRDALLRINVHASTVVKFIELVVAQGDKRGNPKRIKRSENLNRDNHFEEYFGEHPVSSILTSLLDIIFLMKNVNERLCLLQPLCQILSKLLSDQWISGIVCQYNKGSSETLDVPSFVKETQQLVLLTLKDIIGTLQSGHQDNLLNNGNVNLLINFIRSTEDVGTRNHGLSLIASLAKAFPQLVSENIIDLFVAIGDAVKQEDSHSQHVMEDLLSVLVPCWLSKTTSIEKLLQIFIKSLTDVAEHRRVTLMMYLLRTLGENSLSTVIMYLLYTLIERGSHSLSKHKKSHCVLSLSAMSQEWEYGLAVNMTGQYSYKLWFPCLCKLLQEIKVHQKQVLLPMLHLALQFILLKLQDTELRFELEAEEAANSIQNSLGTLMEEVVLCTVSVKDKKGDISGDILKEVRNNSNTVLKIITGWMHASTYFKGITQLLEHPEGLVKRKTLGILCETARANNMVQNKQKKERKLKRSSLSTALQVDKSSCPYFSELCYKILELIDRESDTSVKIAAISSLETLAKEYPSENPAYSKCLATIISHISSGDSVTSSGLINTAGSLINVLGSKALPQLPLIMKNMLQRAHLVSCCPSGKYVHGSPRTDASLSNQSISMLLSVLATIQVIVQKLGEFVSPYLEEILDLVILHPECATQIDGKLDVKAADVRGLLTETVPVRLILPPLLNLYSSATKCGDASLSLSFQMLANVVGTMDRLAVGTYHTKIYEHCLEALDLRRQNLDSLKNINLVEQSITHTIITLTMKLTESTFRPLFLRTLEWAESEVDQSTSKRSMDRAIVFYKLVNKLAEQHRSLFTPYFKYLLEGSVQYLSEDGVLISSKRKKKAKLGDDIVKYKDSLSGQKLWNLRALILKSLHKCFLYDNDQKILDSSNFQTLMKPIVSQFVAEPPESLDSVPDAPSVEEVDEILVSCLGQMAVTARSDVLWKPLNHEVLMQTRSDNVRPKMLGLKVVRYMVQHLKEEYVALVPETIPFLGELLEDVELPVKTLSQEILKEMETLSGESLREYL
ncbi:hypothetical protein VPH35_030803 [Triticum aestivum]